MLPISLALPWGLNVGDMLGHVPAPAKITIQVLQPIDLRERYGENPDLDEVYDDVIGQMQDTLTALQAERTLAGDRLEAMRVEEQIDGRRARARRSGSWWPTPPTARG